MLNGRDLCFNAGVTPLSTGAAPLATAGDLLELVRTGRATTRGELARATGLSRTAVSTRLASLVGAGLLVEGEEAPSTGGRPPASLVFNADAGVVLAGAVGRLLIFRCSTTMGRARGNLG